ncbi:hypothetical protein [Microbacterium binotii]|uniref:hypothetical protein n=1 Tax=Microbacterium binotii TaxID=462710 RepID=UPI001F2514CA|nr:hypothetical protein [Microbacterium binotii]UIN29870.1 hypothetical protein LXM64_12050 [Microbacterium binotii]
MQRTESVSGGLRAVLLSIGVAGVLGYVIQLSVPALTDDVTYVTFSVFWSALYLGGSAMAGVQQEISRAARGGGEARAGSTLASYTSILAGVVVLIVVALVWAFGGALFGTESGELGTMLGLGLVGYLLTAVLTGLLYGIRLWKAVAFIVILDAVLRAVLVVAGLLFGATLPTLAVFIAAPFVVAFATTLIVFRTHIVGRFALDVRLPRLLAHTGGTVVAAASSGLLISGMPMLIGALAPGMSTAATAALILAITVTRAPIVVPIIALQSFLISTVLRDREHIARSRLLAMVGVALLAIGVLSGVGWLVGPGIIDLVSLGKYTISNAMAAVIVASAGLVALLSLTGPALISARRHLANAVGWVVAASSTVLLLALDVGEASIASALLLPAVGGLVCHLFALLTAPARRNPAA